MNSLAKNSGSFVDRERNGGSMTGLNHDTDLLVSDYAGPVSEKGGSEPLSPNPQCKSAAVLYAGIANYTGLSEQNDERTQQRLAEAIRIMMSHVASNNGRIVHLAGDAILAEFKDADNALHCAINVQLSARQWNANYNVGRPVLFRISVNLGDEASVQGDINGNATNLATRLEKLARSGGICVSESVMKDFGDRSSIRFVAMDKQSGKNISEPEHAFLIEFESHLMSELEFTSAIKVSALTP